jgi:hypothetical protein
MAERRSFHRMAGMIALTAAVLSFPGYLLFAGERPDKQGNVSAPSSPESGQKTGEQVFMENCSRCHKPPMTISPRITGTIVMHMRVRAKLSRQDEQALLRYLAP